MRRGLALAALAASLSGCASIERLLDDRQNRCGAQASAALDAVDWSTVPPREVRVSAGEFTPMILHLSYRRPHRLAITNLDATSRVFHASRFFHSAAIAGIDRNGEVSQHHCPHWVVVDGGERAEVRLMPLKRGRFPLSESYLPLDYWGSGLGVIIVE